jgi:hypothetical protein
VGAGRGGVAISGPAQWWAVTAAVSLLAGGGAPLALVGFPSHAGRLFCLLIATTVSPAPTGSPTCPHCLPPPAVLETPLEMVLSMLRSVGAPLDPLTIEGLENIHDDDIRWGGPGWGWGAWGGAGISSHPWPSCVSLGWASSELFPGWKQADLSEPLAPLQRVHRVAAAHGDLQRDQAPRRLL